MGKIQWDDQPLGQYSDWCWRSKHRKTSYHERLVVLILRGSTKLCGWRRKAPDFWRDTIAQRLVLFAHSKPWLRTIWLQISHIQCRRHAWVAAIAQDRSYLRVSKEGRHRVCDVCYRGTRRITQASHNRSANDRANIRASITRLMDLLSWHAVRIPFRHWWRSQWKYCHSKILQAYCWALSLCRVWLANP